MAKLFDRYKTYRARKTILSADANAMQDALSASFSKIGDAPAAGLRGVSTAFAVGEPTLPAHAVSKDHYESTLEANISGYLANEQAAAQASADAAAQSASEASAIRFEDAFYLAFFFGQS